MPKTTILICPEPLSRGFRFSSECPIKSCKNWTELANSRCLALLRSKLVDGDVMSVAEAAHFKQVSVDQAEMALLEAQHRVKSLTLFNQYWDFSRSQSSSDENTSFEASVYLAEWLTNYPMAIGKWDHADFATIKRLFSATNFQAWADSSSFGEEIYDLGQLSILHTTKPRFNQICLELGITE